MKQIKLIIVAMVVTALAIACNNAQPKIDTAAATADSLAKAAAVTAVATIDTLVAAKADTSMVYVCKMHADVKGKAGGKCPKCGMALEAMAHPADTTKKAK